MKTISIVVSLLLLNQAPMPASAQHDHAAQAAPATATTRPAALTDGEIKKVDREAGKVTIAHGPMPSGMPAMTMVFRVQDPAWLEQLAVGQKIRFDAQTVQGAMTITYFEPAN